MVRYDLSKYPTLLAALGKRETIEPEEDDAEDVPASSSQVTFYNPANYSTLIGILTAGTSHEDDESDVPEPDVHVVLPTEDSKEHIRSPSPSEDTKPPARQNSTSPPPVVATDLFNKPSEEVGTKFRAVVNVSQKGIHPVLRYDIPGGSTCYTFAYQKRRAKYEVYCCSGCRSNGTRTTIEVRDGEFFSEDPCLLEHVCSPKNSAEDEANRLVYKACQEICVTPEFASKKPRQLWQEISNYVDLSSEDPHRREEMLTYFRKRGYKSRRKTLSRALEKLRKHGVPMTEAQEDDPEACSRTAKKATRRRKEENRWQTASYEGPVTQKDVKYPSTSRPVIPLQ
nr:unnamed protein product [Haemonchus contortus]